MQTLSIFGDSIVWGESDIINGGWVNHLRRYLVERNIILGLYNLGIDGDTSKGLFKRFDNEISIRATTNIIIAVGINDSAYRKVLTNNETSPTEFANNIKALIKKAKHYTSHIAFIGLTNVDEFKTKPFILSSSGKCYDNGLIKQYNDIVKQIADEMKIPFIYCFNILNTHDVSDGLHPNTEGHLKLFHKIKDELEKVSFFK